MPAVTGSAATGQASGAAGLVISYARQKGIQLQPNEIKQLLTMTAFDVDAPEHGRPRRRPTRRSRAGTSTSATACRTSASRSSGSTRASIPPQALITSPQWFAPLNVEPAARPSTSTRASRRNRAAGYTYRLQWAPGIEPAESDFQRRHDAATRTTPDRRLARHDRPAAQVRAALDARPGGGATVDPTAPAQGPGRQGPERAGLHRARGRHRHRRQPRRGPQGAVRLPRHDAAPGLRARTSAPAARRRRGCST